MAVFSETGKKITNKQIIKIEKKIGCSFPVEYKNFLLTFNGGECEPCGYTFMENSVESEGEIRSFFAIGGIDGDYDLAENISDYVIDEQRMPSLYFPIAEDDGGNLICISCNSSDYGNIYCWDHENECDKEGINNYKDNMYLISLSFDEFIGKLKNID
jgi:cell wall assembly regulator SMI1